MTQRIILNHLTGRLTGLSQIIGTVDQFDGETPSVLTPMPQISEVLRGDTREVSYGLIQSKPRFRIYREIVAPEGLGTFDRRQQ